MINLDDTDRRLIGLLRDDARLPVASLAAALGISRATVKARMDKLEAAGVIQGYTVILTQDTANAPVRAIAMIEVEGRVTDKVAKALAGFPQIRALSSTNGRWDLVAEIETASLYDFDKTLNAIRLIEGVTLTETSILLASRLRRERN
ncbi:Lrp/AsnC family transcriptional regulator [Pelagibacterium halotolerans]|uniref:Lrp/AsnC family transcriptional regulator n=1 Tax=Pelagibacterium halotolerans TaxID=531813 RepID=UPI0038500E94